MKAIEQAVKAMEAASFILGAYTPDRWNQELTAKWRERAAELDAAIAALESEEVVAEGWLYSKGYIGDDLVHAKFARKKIVGAIDSEVVRILAVKEEP